MKNILTIGKKGITSGDFFASVAPDYCNLVMFIDLKNDDLLEKLSRYDLLIKAVMEESFLEPQEAKDFLATLFSYENIIDAFDYVDLDAGLGDTTIPKNLLAKNSWIKSKKIILSSDEISITDAVKLANEYSEYKNQLIFKLKGNKEYVSYEDVLSMSKLMDSYVDSIKSCNLTSKLELVMLSYDIVRNLVYRSFDEAPSEEITIFEKIYNTNSAQLNFSLLFSELLNYLGINSKIVNHYSEINRNKKLSRVSAYIKDDKYNVDGIYVFDPFLDCMKGLKEKKYPTLYNYFLKTTDEVEKCDKEKFPWEKFESREEIQEGNIKGLSISEIESLGTSKWKHIEYLYELVTGDTFDFVKNVLISSEKEKKSFIDKIYEFEKMMNKPIDTKTRLSLFDNVRRAEYYYNINSLDYNVEDMLAVMESSGWNIDESEITPKDLNKREKELLGLFGGVSYKVIGLRKFIKEQNIEKNVSGVRLTKTLKKYLENKQNDCM